MGIPFDWDPAKARQNAQRHGVSFEEAKTAFGDPMALIAEDPYHSLDEQRYVLIGYSERQRIIAAMFTERGALIRLISARRATNSERLAYEEASRQ